MQVERHTWHCMNCEQSGETFSTLLTDSNSFRLIVFRDHDLISPNCKTDELSINVTNGPKWDWTIKRT